jgi:hypothetical protein
LLCALLLALLLTADAGEFPLLALDFLAILLQGSFGRRPSGSKLLI